MRKWIAATGVLCVCLANQATRVNGAAGDEVYSAIRTNDLNRLRTLVKTKTDANAADPTGETPLMQAAVAGSLDAMKFLVAQGADVNAQNAFGSTALIWSATDLAKTQFLLDNGANVNIAAKTGRTALFTAAMSDESAAIVKALIAKGADVKARDAFQNTMLVAAAFGGDRETIGIMLNAGIDVNAAGIVGTTPLHLAVGHNDVAAVKLLLSKGANVNAVAAKPGIFPFDDPKSGPLALTNATPLLSAAGTTSSDIVKALVDAGANVNATDGRKMTPLMFALTSNHQSASAIKLLIDKGANVSTQSTAGETAADWARKIGDPIGLQALNITSRATAATSPAAASARPEVKMAISRSLTLLDSSSQKFFETSGCVSCHHQNIADFAAGEVRAKGLPINMDAAAGRMKMLAAMPPPALLLERMDIGVPEILASMMTSLAAMDVPPSPITDKLAANIAATQTADGSWHLLGAIGNRPPVQEGSISRTALCVRSLKVYAPPARAAETNARIAKARAWLMAATPGTSEERNMRLLGLWWAGADSTVLKPLAAEILREQQKDGGWRQRDVLSSDAYATGQSLYALAKTGMLSASDPIYQKGVTYLLSTQADTGAWRVMSRAAKFQAYFNSGFPYGGDQWISAWATGWATMALAQAVGN